MGSLASILLTIQTGGLADVVKSGQRAKAGLDRPANEAKAAANAQTAAAKEAASAAEKRAANEESAAAAATTAQQARDRQKQLASGAGGKRSTLLTGSLGITAPQPAARKTLLGQ